MTLRPWLSVILFVSTFSISSRAQFSQPGELDTTFNFGRPHSFFSNLTNLQPGEGANNTIFTQYLQPDGKVLVGGKFTSYNGTFRTCIARLNVDGKPDVTFNLAVVTGLFFPAVNAMVMQPDGKILISGEFSAINGVSRNGIARLNANGSLDNFFNPGSGANLKIQSLALQPNGKILIGGSFTSFNGTPRNRISRLNENGSLDNTFNSGTGSNGIVNSLALQSGGKILIAGDFNSYDGIVRNRIARLNSDGSLDTTFNSGNGVNSTIHFLILQADNKALIGGDFTTFDGFTRNRIARLNTDGSLDVSFDSGTGADNGIFSIAIQTDNKVLIGGNFTSFDGTPRNRIARLNADGSLDSTFNPGTGANSSVNSAVLQIDGKVLIGGSFLTYNGTGGNHHARLNTDGSPDVDFNPGTGANSTIWSITQQQDGKALICGFFRSVNGVPRNHIARVNLDGSIDSTFNSNLGANLPVFSLVVQPNSKIVIGGDFTSYNGTPRNRIARLNSDGSLDTVFDPGSGANGTINSLILQLDGKVLIGGNFTNYNGTVRNRIARLNADGSLDTTFSPGSGANMEVYSLAIQQNGKVLLGGAFFEYNGTTQRYLVRVNADGKLDSTFNTGTGPSNIVNSFALQQDGKILIGGYFIDYNNTSRNRIARLNVDGSLDTTFNLGAGADGTIRSVALQQDGKVLIAGDFINYNSTFQPRFARLNTNGSLDLGFNTGSGASGIQINSIVLQSDGKVLIGGEFSQYNGISRTRLARVWGGSSTVGVPLSEPSNQMIKLYPNPTTDRITVEALEPFQYELYSITGKRVQAKIVSQSVAELTTEFLSPGTYVLRIITTKGVETRKLVKE